MKIKTQKIKVNNFDGTYKDIYGVVGDKGDKGEPFDDTKVKNEVKDINNGIDALKKMSEGVVWDFETDTEKAYSKPVPNGAKYLNVQSIGGESIVWNQQLQKIGSLVEYEGLTMTLSNDYIFSITGTFTSGGLFSLENFFSFKTYKDHVYLISNPVKCNMYRRTKGTTKDIGTVLGDGTIFTETVTSEKYFMCQAPINKVFNSSGQFYLIDLTECFGARLEPKNVYDYRITMLKKYVAIRPGRNNNIIIDTKVNDIIVGETHNPISYPTLRSIYSKIYDEADFENNKITFKVQTKRLDTLNWQKKGTLFVAQNISGNFIQTRYTRVADNQISLLGDKELSWNETEHLIYVHDEAYAYQDISKFLNSLMNHTIYIERSNPFITSLSQTIEPIKVNTGDTITFEQEATQFPINNKLEYIIKLSERM